MPISPDILSSIGDLQAQIWQTASQNASEAAGFDIKLADPLTTSVSSADVLAEVASPRLLIQFAFTGMEDNPTILLVPQETFGNMAGSLRGGNPEVIDESLIPETQAVWETIVQGISVAISSNRSEPVLASDLKIKFQLLNLPKNLQGPEDLVRINVGFGCEDFNGTLTWLMDLETSHYLLGLNSDESGRPVFAPLSDHDSRSHSGHDLPTFDESGLEIIMDIPLEISVELGRVKMQVRDVVELGAGSIVEIDKTAGEPVDVMVNGRLVARGEVVVIDDNFGVRITEILSVQERLQKLNEAA